MNPYPTADPLPCEICGRSTEGTEQAHIIPRSQGGTETLWLCRECHNHTEDGHEWVLDVSAERILVTARATGETIVWRPKLDEGAQQEIDGTLIAWVQAIPTQVDQRYLQQIRMMSDSALHELFDATRGINTAAWLIRAECLYTALERTPYGKKTEKTVKVGKQFGLSRAQTYDILAARALYLSEFSERSEKPPLSQSLLGVAAQAVDPAIAVAIIEEQVSQNPEYSVSQARRDIASREAVEGGQGLARALTLLRQAYALLRDASELIAALEASLEADQIAEVAHNIYELAWQIGDRASPALHKND